MAEQGAVNSLVASSSLAIPVWGISLVVKWVLCKHQSPVRLWYPPCDTNQTVHKNTHKHPIHAMITE